MPMVLTETSCDCTPPVLGGATVPPVPHHQTRQIPSAAPNQPQTNGQRTVRLGCAFCSGGSGRQVVANSGEWA